MEDQEKAIRAAFVAEARERLGKARTELEYVPDTPALDRLHQEFDSLHGAARAVNCRTLERLSRAAAEFARWLRREPVDPGPEELELMERGIALMEHAAGLQDGCERDDIEDELRRCLQLIRTRTEPDAFGRGE